MSKRKVEFGEDVYFEEVDKQQKHEHIAKHTLDSDEEDDEDNEEQYNILDENDIEGEEDGIARVDGEVKFTAFNMKEELEEGHFDQDGHYIWNKDKEIKDNWLDNIDWIKIKSDPKAKNDKPSTSKGLGDSDDSEEDDEPEAAFNMIDTYKEILALLQPKETIKKALQRLGKSTVKLTTAQRFKNKKAGIVDPASEKITQLTALSNEILTRSGNMDIYDESYEIITKKIENAAKKGPKIATTTSGAIDDLDMYADDFDSKEKNKLHKEDEKPEEIEEEIKKEDVLMWEYKDKDTEEQINGPFTSEQMLKYSTEGKFKEGAVVRKVGAEDSMFYSLARIDFDLYI